jgi:hypothetical protein
MASFNERVERVCRGQSHPIHPCFNVLPEQIY